MGSSDRWLAPGEKVVYAWPGSTAEPGLGGRLAARSVHLEATNQHRLRLSLEQEDERVIRHVFQSPADVQIQIIGPGHRKVAMLPTVLVDIAWGGQSIRVLLNDTLGTYLPRWSQSFGSLSAPGSAVHGQPAVGLTAP